MFRIYIVFTMKAAIFFPATTNIPGKKLTKGRFPSFSSCRWRWRLSRKCSPLGNMKRQGQNEEKPIFGSKMERNKRYDKIILSLVSIVAASNCRIDWGPVFGTDPYSIPNRDAERG